ncbi:MAG: lytic transglycosylase domain-containing protein [Campylobacter sp.]|nr:lytic transglycosylase domain-containing protein [Campylobacter sp.]
MLVRFFGTVVLLCVVALGEMLPYEKLRNEPKSLAKDYYIYRLIDETNYNKNEIKELKKSVYRNRGKLKTALDKIFPPAKPKDICKDVNKTTILDANETCKIARMKPWFIRNLDKSTKNRLIEHFINMPDIANLLQGYNEQNPAKFYASSGNAKNYLAYYNSLKDKSEQFNFAITPEFASNLATQKGFSAFISTIILEKKLPKLRASLVASFEASGDTAFWLGINSVMYKDRARAYEFFKMASNTQKEQFNIDNAKFWMYLTSKNADILLELSQSKDLNMYSLYAREIVGNSVVDVVIPEPHKAKAPDDYDISNPFDWVRLKNRANKASADELKALASKFDTKETMGEYIYIVNRLSGFRDNFYPVPFSEYLEGDLDRKALILALARQESRFVPSAISTSYALGMMQFMPFVANDIGKKQLKIANFDQDDMFKPEIAYKFANHHLDWLERYLLNPVFIGYAYNGGIGFTKKLLLRGDLFNDGEFEPFLSMELVPYAESRKYSKHVLANYVIYRQILSADSNTSILQLLQNLVSPKLSDRFRK